MAAHRTLAVLAVFILLASLPASAQAVDQDAESEKLMALSRAWSDAVGAGRFDEALNFWADDAVLMAPGMPPIHGKEGIREFVMGMAEIPGFSIRWEPLEAHIAASSDMAYLIERNQITMPDASGTLVTEHNKVVTIWRREPDGSWKNVVDMWNAEPPPPAGHGDADQFPSFTDPEELRLYAQAIVDEFGVQSVAAGHDLGPAPIIEVRNTPVLIYYSGSQAKIGMPWWPTLPAEQNAMFTVFGGDEVEGERIFRAFFYRFLVAHEAGHWFQARTNSRQPTLYASEDMANRIAVAFWMTQPDGEAFLGGLEEMLVGIVERVPDPTPPGEDPVAFFGENYMALAEDGVGYGYFQFRFMRDAIRDRHQLSLADMVVPAPAE